VLLPDHGRAPLDGVAHPRRDQVKLPGQRREGQAHLPRGSEAEEAPSGHLPALAPGGHDFSRVQVKDLRHPLDHVLESDALALQGALPGIPLMDLGQDPRDEIRLPL
jgi:hypothetical protein